MKGIEPKTGLMTGNIEDEGRKETEGNQRKEGEKNEDTKA